MGLTDALATLNRNVATSPRMKQKLASRSWSASTGRGRRCRGLRTRTCVAVSCPDMRPNWISPVAAAGRSKRSRAPSCYLPHKIPQREWREWEARSTRPRLPQPLQEALDTYRAAWRAKMEE